MTSSDNFMTPDELVDRYKGNISVKTLANWRTKGGGPEYVKIGGKIMYMLSAVTAWERLRTYGSTAVKAANDAAAIVRQRVSAVLALASYLLLHSCAIA